MTITKTSALRCTVMYAIGSACFLFAAYQSVAYSSVFSVLSGASAALAFTYARKA